MQILWFLLVCCMTIVTTTTAQITSFPYTETFDTASATKQPPLLENGSKNICRLVVAFTSCQMDEFVAEIVSDHSHRVSLGPGLGDLTDQRSAACGSAGRMVKINDRLPGTEMPRQIPESNFHRFDAALLSVRIPVIVMPFILFQL